MRRYWINYKGKQSGPLSIEQLEGMGVDKTAYVWHSGLDDWVKITKVPELNEMLEKMENGGSEATVPTSDSVENMTSEPEQVPDLPADDEIPDLPPFYGRQSNAVGNPYYQGTPQYANGGSYPASQAVAENPKCPPTNLVWAIISTLCCCLPLGILGIVFAYLTKKNYKGGNYEKAEKFSDYGAWSIIAAIIIGLITTPLSCSYSMMLQNLG